MEEQIAGFSTNLRVSPLPQSLEPTAQPRTAKLPPRLEKDWLKNPAGRSRRLQSAADVADLRGSLQPENNLPRTAEKLWDKINGGARRAT